MLSQFKITAILFVFCFFLLPAAGSATEPGRQDLPSYTWWDRSLDKEEPPRPENTYFYDWPYRARVLSARYEDRYTFLHGRLYTVDPWVWAYIPPFAERFHMPEKWIEPELEGALGVAFRMMFPLTVQCGLGGDPKNCSATPRCQLDVYYDATIDLPWLHDDQIRDNLMEGMHSGLFLQDPEYQVRSTNQYYRQRPGPDGIPQPGPLASPVVFRSGDQNITGTVAHFDREYMPGVGLISWFGLCPTQPDPGAAALTFPDSTGVPQHVMRFPGSWMQRAHQIWLAHKDEQNAPLLTSVLEKVDELPPSSWQQVKSWLADHNPFASRPAPPPPIDSSAYERAFVQGDGRNPFTADPFTWVYTRAFAERFGMPEKWIELELEGALAVAFRMVDLNIFDCGYGGSEHSCWPPTTCQMDMYYDTGIALPWNKPFMRDNTQHTLHSGRFLHHPTFRNRGVNRYTYGPADLDDEGYEGPIEMLGARGAGLFFLYDRAYRPGIGLVSWLGHCPEAKRKRPASTKFMYKKQAGENENTVGDSSRVAHQVVYPEGFWSRANVVYEAGNHAVKQTIRGLVNRFFEKRKATPDP